MKWPWSVKTLDERSCEEVGTMLWIKGDNPPATPRLNRRNLLNFLNLPNPSSDPRKPAKRRARHPTPARQKNIFKPPQPP